MAVAAAFVRRENKDESAPNTPEKNAETISRPLGCTESSTEVDTIDMNVRPMYRWIST